MVHATIYFGIKNFVQHFSLKIKLKWPDIFLTIFGLPPGVLAVRFEGGDDILYPVIDSVVHWVIWPSGVAVKTLFFILQQDQKWLKYLRRKGQRPIKREI